jgi:DNA-binding NarL/FixJ family response regulator
MNVADYIDRLKADIENAREAMCPSDRDPGLAHLYLTPQEIRAFRLLSMGLSNAEICDELRIEHSTMRTYLKRIHDKCQIEGRSRLIAVACYIWPSEPYPQKGRCSQAASQNIM